MMPSTMGARKKLKISFQSLFKNYLTTFPGSKLLKIQSSPQNRSKLFCTFEIENVHGFIASCILIRWNFLKMIQYLKIALFLSTNDLKTGKAKLKYLKRFLILRINFSIWCTDDFHLTSFAIFVSFLKFEFALAVIPRIINLTSTLSTLAAHIIKTVDYPVG